jgi:hypothetical protein
MSHVWTLCIGSGPNYDVPWCSNPLLSPNALTTYEVPQVTGVEAVLNSGGTWGTTRGNDTVRLYGINFGVPWDKSAQVRFSPPYLWCGRVATPRVVSRSLRQPLCPSHALTPQPRLVADLLSLPPPHTHTPVRAPAPPPPSLIALLPRLHRI